MHTRPTLADQFRALGIAPGDIVMVHASVRAVGPIVGGPDQIHLALKDALTDRGTLMMYASCPAHYDEVGRGNLSAHMEREVLEKLPAFDPLTARAQRENGTLVEFFRSYPGSLVNGHVARFVVWGRQARYLISHQPWDFAVGRGSALERLVTLNGKILLLGCDHDTVTFLHYAEHIADTIRRNYALGVDFYFFTDDNLARAKNWEAFFDMLIRLREEEGIAIEFMIQADVPSYRMKNFLPKAKKAGCTKVFLGVESLDNDTLAAAGKRQNVAANARDHRRAGLAWPARPVRSAGSRRRSP